MKNRKPALVCRLAITALAVSTWQAESTGRWMTPEEMRADFVGRTLQGAYFNGMAWTSTHREDGGLDYHENEMHAPSGHWYFRGPVLCHFYGPPFLPPNDRGCSMPVKVGTNCYEFHLVHKADDGDLPMPDGPWHSRGWRRGEPSTCEPKPTV